MTDTDTALTDETLAAVRADLLAAVTANPSARAPRVVRYRKLIVGTAIVAGVGSLGTVAAATTMGWLGPPAPAGIQSELSEWNRHPLPGGVDADGQPRPSVTFALGAGVELARDGALALNGASGPDGSYCVVVADAGTACRPSGGGEEPFWLTSGGGLDSALKENPDLPHIWRSAVYGRVQVPGAVTVEIDLLAGAAPIRVPVGREGFFVARLPDAPAGPNGRAGGGGPSGQARALDSDDRVVATYGG